MTDLNIKGAIFWNAKVTNSTLTKEACEHLKKEEAISENNQCN